MATVQAAAPAPKSPAVHVPKKPGTVTVACKIPHGLILQLCKKTAWVEDTPSGSRDRIRYDRHGPRVFVRGTAYPVQPGPEFPERGPMAGGFALTAGVDAEFFDQWLEQNKQSPVVVNGLIFAEPTRESTKAKAEEFKSKRTGLEPLDITLNAKGESNDPRVPRPASRAVGIITKAEVG